MKRFLLQTIIALFLISGLNLFAQNPPQMDVVKDDTIIINTLDNYILIPEISDGDDFLSQDIVVDAISSNNSIVEVISVDYDTANNFAVLNVQEKGLLGTATITVTASDIDGVTSNNFNLTVSKYNNDGIKFELHDLVFWRQKDCYDFIPVWDTIAMSGEAPFGSINWDKFSFDVSKDCNAPQCTGHDFITTFFRGYLVPPSDGSYTFYYNAVASFDLQLSSNESFINREQIIFFDKSGNKPNIGTQVDSNLFWREYQSAEVTLKKDKVYAITASNWVVHDTKGGIKWEGPGISKQYIPSENLIYTYDTIFPTKPNNLKLDVKGVEYIKVSWDIATDNVKVIGYNIYVDGNKINQDLIKTNYYTIESLLANTKYSVVVTAVDEIGNESEISNIINVTTYPTDTGNPEPPTNIIADELTGVAILLSWSGAIDAETEVVAYNIYIDGNLYNTDGYYFADTIILKPLTPETSYNIEIEAIDAGNNISSKSSIFPFSTTKFNVGDTDLGVKTAGVKILVENNSWSEGFGVNVTPAWQGTYQETEVKSLMADLKPALIRWSNFAINNRSFAPATGLSPSEDNVLTLADHINQAIDMDVYCSYGCGLNDSTDWMLDSQTFLNFMEYIAGPSTSTWGAVRAAEGYTEPLLPKCKGLIFEIGCEAWGGIDHWAPIAEDYVAYGQWARDMATIVKSSPYYDPDKIWMTYSGRNCHPSDSYGLHDKMLTGDQGEVDWVQIGGYIHGNLDLDPDSPTGADEALYYKQTMSKIAKNIDGLKLTMETEIDLTGAIKPSFFYETNAILDNYFGRLGQAIMETDFLATAYETGSTLPTLFDLRNNQWKMTIKSEGYKKLPLYYTCRFFNHHCKGNIMKTEVASSYPLLDEYGNSLNFEPVGSHAYTSDDKYSILLLSRDFESDYILQLDLPDDLVFNSSAKMYTISGLDYNTSDATIDSADIILTDSLLITLPKFSMILITFTGDNQNFPQLPIGWYGDYVKAESMTIIPQGGGAPEINVDDGYLILDLEIYPEDAISQPKWEFVTNDINLAGGVNNEGSFILVSNGKCENNGKALIKAYAADDPSIFDTITVIVTNQVDQGGCVSEITENDITSVNIFPNPATNSFSIQTNGEGQKVNVFNLQGQKVFSYDQPFNFLKLDTKNWNKGLYIVNISSFKSSKSILVSIE